MEYTHILLKVSSLALIVAKGLKKYTKQIIFLTLACLCLGVSLVYWRLLLK